MQLKMMWFFFTDYGVWERHNQVDSILGALDIEKESFQKAQFFAWVFFPIWIFLAIVQAVCFVLSNGRFHPLSKILEGKYNPCTIVITRGLYYIFL